MTFARMDYTLATCRAHLTATGTLNTEVENYLVGYVLVRLCAEFEMCLEKICEIRALKSGDPHVVNIVRKWAARQTFCMTISELTGTIGCFGDDYKQAFRQFRDDPANQPILVAWDAIHGHRKNVAHLMPAPVSLTEFEVFYADAKKVLIALAQSMTLTPAEIAALTWP
jgi:hypothetical protein